MPHRRLVKIGEPAPLPTISQFLNEMATRQHEEIERLKREALSGSMPGSPADEHHENLTPDPWQLHPVRIKKAAKKTAKKTARTKQAPSRKPRTKASKATSQVKNSRSLKTKNKKAARKTR